MELLRLNSMLGRAEREMSAFRRRYARAAELRTQAGLQLLDRNDELCALYEEEHMQRRALVEAVVGLKARC